MASKWIWHALHTSCSFLRIRHHILFVSKSLSHAGKGLTTELLVTQRLNYLRKAEKYAATTCRVQRDFEDDNAQSLFTKLDLASGRCSDPKAIRNLSKAELLLLLSLLSTNEVENWSETLTRKLDLECARRVALWGADTCLLVMDHWLAWLGTSDALKLAFFNVLMREWHLVRNCDLPGHVTQLLYYVGLAKRAPLPLMQAAEKWLEKHVTALADEDAAIVCQGFFRSSTRLTSDLLLDNISARVKAVADSGSTDSSTLICFLKALRHARHEDPDLCHCLARFLKRGVLTSGAPLVSCAHYAAFFASCRYYDRDLFDLLENRAHEIFVSELEVVATASSTQARSMHPSKLSRMKDAARILWAMSEVGHRAGREDFWERAADYLRRRVRKHGWYLRPGHFADCLHSLAVVGVFPDDLLDLVPKLDFGSYEEATTAHRHVHLLSASVCIERAVKKSGARYSRPAPISNPDSKCDYLNLIHDLLKTCCGGNEELYRRHFRLGHIPIEGLEMLLDMQGEFCSLQDNYHGKERVKVALEVVEPTRCLQNGFQPVGLHVMKQRQLEKLGYHVATIFPQHVHELECKSLSEKVKWLKRFLKKSCVQGFNLG